MLFPRALALFFAASLSTQALAAPPTVVADTPVAQSLAAMVLGDLATPALLLEAGADPHHFQMRPSHARMLSRADLVVWTSPVLSPWLARPLGALSQGVVVVLDAAPGLRFQPFAASALIDNATEPSGDHGEDHDRDDDHDHAHDHTEGHTHEHGDHPATAHDPHLWLDPDNAAAMLRALAEAFARFDPENAVQYADNAATAVDALGALRREIAAILAPASAANLVMYHDAYGYFATAFGLRIVGTVTAGDAADPGAARIAAIRQALQGAHVTCLFPEANHSDRLARLAVEGSDVRLGAALDPSGTTLPAGAALYGQTLRGLAQAIAECVAAG